MAVAAGVIDADTYPEELLFQPLNEAMAHPALR